MHFRRLPATTCSEDGVETYWAPLCSTRALPRRGDVTTEAHRVTCNDCRAVLKLPRLAEFEDDSERRYP